MVMNATDLDFKEKVIEKSKEIPIVVDFWAEWCSPCIILGPILEELERELKNRFILVKINVDNAPEISKKYNIMSIPSVKMFKIGKAIAEFVGALPKEQVKEWLNKNLEK
jgi:putative thioredoxin